MLVLVISAMKALTLLMKRWSAYLAYIMEGKMVTPTLEEILVVKDFPEVFPIKLNGLLLQRMVEFVIKLDANTAPISTTLFRMTLS